MKKLIIIIIGAFTLLFGVNVKCSTFYTLDTPIFELNNHTLREVFENRNIAMPNLTGKTEISTGVYRLYNADGVVLDYDVNSGVSEINGTATSTVVYDFTRFDNTLDEYRTLSVRYVSGIVVSGNNEIGILLNGTGPGIPIRNNNYLTPLLSQSKNNVNQLLIYIESGAVLINYKVKIQLEKGSSATPYQVPTSGPYNDFDVSTLGLTTEEIDYWFSVYQDLLKDIDRVSQLPNLFIDLFNELTDNFVIGIKGFTELIYLPGYGLTDLGIISLIVLSISVIGVGFYIIRKVIK